MDIIVIRGIENAGKTTTAKLTFDELSKQADSIHLFDHYNEPIKSLHYNSKGEVYDFKAVIKIKGKIVVIITAGDEPWRLMINIKFIIDFVKKTFKVVIDILLCCGRSFNREGSVVMRLKADFPHSKLLEVWVHRVAEQDKMKNKEEAVMKVIQLIAV